jgi:hypothetical protein
VPRQPNLSETTRVAVSLSSELAAYLDDLVEIGIHGKTRSEVAKSLISVEAERLIRDGFLRLRPPMVKDDRPPS